MDEIVEISWLDACCEGVNEMTLKDMDNLHPVPRKNVGYLIRQTDEEILISAGISHWSQVNDGDDCYTYSLTVPRGMLTGFKRLT